MNNLDTNKLQWCRNQGARGGAPPNIQSGGPEYVSVPPPIITADILLNNLFARKRVQNFRISPKDYIKLPELPGAPPPGPPE